MIAGSQCYFSFLQPAKVNEKQKEQFVKIAESFQKKISDRELGSGIVFCPLIQGKQAY